jgi:hypothetical protein
MATSTKQLSAKLSSTPLVVLGDGAPPAYKIGVYISTIGRLVGRVIATGQTWTIQTGQELHDILSERGPVGECTKLNALRSEAIIAETHASKPTRDRLRSTIVKIERALALLAQQTATVREVA